MENLIWNGKKLIILASDQDIASMTIAKQVEQLELPVFYIKKKSFLHVSDEDLPFADYYLVLSRHSSAAGEPAFTVHSVGNYSPENPKLGGKPAVLGKTQTEIQTYLLYSLSKVVEQEKNFANFDVVSEATHHGPLISKPLVFIEMGSNQDVWENKNAAKIIAQAIQYFLSTFSIIENPLQPAIGFGGGHYPRKIANSMLNLDFSVGHICPKYALRFLNEELIKQMIKTSIASNKVEIALFDKKGMNRKKEIREIVQKYGLEVKEL